MILYCIVFITKKRCHVSAPLQHPNSYIFRKFKHLTSFFIFLSVMPNGLSHCMIQKGAKTKLYPLCMILPGRVKAHKNTFGIDEFDSIISQH